MYNPVLTRGSVQREHACLDKEWAQSEGRLPLASESPNGSGYERLTTHETAKFFSPLLVTHTTVAQFLGRDIEPTKFFWSHRAEFPGS